MWHTARVEVWNLHGRLALHAQFVFYISVYTHENTYTLQHKPLWFSLVVLMDNMNVNEALRSIFRGECGWTEKSNE